MADERLIENASEFLEEQTEARIAAITSAVPRGRIGAAECQECGEPIPDARRWEDTAGVLSVWLRTRRGPGGFDYER